MLLGAARKDCQPDIEGNRPHDAMWSQSGRSTRKGFGDHRSKLESRVGETNMIMNRKLCEPARLKPERPKNEMGMVQGKAHNRAGL